MGNTFYFEFEPILMEWIQEFLGENVIDFISHFSAFGEEMIILLVLGILYWCYDKEFGIYVATNALVAVTVNPLIKNIALRRRPYFDHEGITCYRPVEKGADIYDISAQGYSFPSGHSMNSATIYISLARFAKRRILAIIAIIIPLLVGISRVVVGVHYPTDVVLGWFMGLLIAFFVPMIYEKAGKEKRPVVNLIVFLVLSIGFFYCNTTDYFTGMGLMAGFFLAVEFEKKYVNFSETRKPLIIIIRLAIGLLLYVVLNNLLKMPFSGDFLSSATTASFLVRFARYGIVSFVLLGVYPLAFKVFDRIMKVEAVNGNDTRA